VAGPGAEKQTWSDIAERLALSRSYWLVTTNPDGSPHAAPVWGVVVDDALCLYSERTTVKARNLARDRRAVVHLESTEDVIIVHGELEDLGGPVEVPEVVYSRRARGARYFGASRTTSRPSGAGRHPQNVSAKPESLLAPLRPNRRARP